MITINLFTKNYDNETMQKAKNQAIEHAKHNPRNSMFKLEYNELKNVYLVKSKDYKDKLFAVTNQFEDMNKKEIECFIANQYYNECVFYL